MKMTFMGVGSAFSLKNANSNLMVESGKIRLAVDCGHTLSASLQEKSLSTDDLTDIVITHLHADHIGGLEEVAIMGQFLFKRKVRLLATESLLDRLWECSLRGGLEYIEEVPGSLTPKTLADYFVPVPIPVDEWFAIEEGQPLYMKLQPTKHVLGMESYGMQFTESPKGPASEKVFFSGDTKFNPPMIEQQAKECGLIFHDCQLTETGENNESGVHTSYSQLLKIPKEQQQKIWLYHYGDEPLPNAKEDGFQGFVTHQQSFEI